MKKAATLLFSLLLIGFSVKATPDTSEGVISSEENNTYDYDGKSYIFVEGTVEFSVFPDGQFDFVYVGPQQGSDVNIRVNTPNVAVSFNSGYDYEAYVQYDDYGAIIQVEDTPIYYDEYGRIVQAGNTEIQYTDRRIVRVGGLRVFYNHNGYFSHYSGHINLWTPRYVYRPWHVYYARPYYSNCVVYDYPYRRYYTPTRYSYGYHKNYYKKGNHKYANGRRDFYRPGSRNHYKDGRVVKNGAYNPNRRNTFVSDSGRSNPNTARSASTNRTNTGASRNIINGSNTRGTNTSRSNTTRQDRQVKQDRSNTRAITTSRNNSVRPANRTATTRTATSRNVNANRKAATSRSTKTASTSRSKTPARVSSGSRNQVTKSSNTRASNPTATRSSQRKSSSASRGANTVKRTAETRSSRKTTAQRSSNKSAKSSSRSDSNTRSGRGI